MCPEARNGSSDGVIGNHSSGTVTKTATDLSPGQRRAARSWMFDHS